VDEYKPPSSYDWLTTTPADDINFKSALKSATVEELQNAIEKLKHKARAKRKLMRVNVN
jgi:hypothetical protein